MDRFLFKISRASSAVLAATLLGSSPLSMLISSLTHSWHGIDGENQQSIDFQAVFGFLERFRVI